jgi:hypothetical protein
VCEKRREEKRREEKRREEKRREEKRSPLSHALSSSLISFYYLHGESLGESGGEYLWHLFIEIGI